MQTERTEMNGKLNTPAQLCAVKRLQYAGGRAGGERVALVENGVLSFTVLEDRALDLYDLRYRGQNISFLSKNGLCGFAGEYVGVFPGGMLYTCGLDVIGGSATPVHGKIHNIPAEVESVLCDENGIEIIGTVRQSALFGENLLLRRRISTKYGSGKLQIDTEIVNEGARDTEYCLLFHINFGYPFLDEGVKISAPLVKTIPRTPWASAHAAQCFEIGAPDECEEQVFYHTVSRGEVELVNAKMGLRAGVRYDEKEMPALVEWKSMLAGDYALGIEPSTTKMDDGFHLRRIRAGEVHRYPLTLEFGEI